MYRKKMIKILLVILCVIAVAIVAVVLFLQTPSFGRLPRGERLERIKRSPNFRDGEFRNMEPTVLMTSEKGKWGAMLDFVFKKVAGRIASGTSGSVGEDGFACTRPG